MQNLCRIYEKKCQVKKKITVLIYLKSNQINNKSKTNHYLLQFFQNYYLTI